MTMIKKEYEMDSAKTMSLAMPSWFKNDSSRLAPSVTSNSLGERPNKSPIFDCTPGNII